jgi:hypothetical protein
MFSWHCKDNLYNKIELLLLIIILSFYDCTRTLMRPNEYYSIFESNKSSFRNSATNGKKQRHISRNNYEFVLLLITFGICCVLVRSCLDLPVSVSNITSCIGTNCFYQQLATNILDLDPGTQECFNFASLSNSSQTFSLNVTVSDSSAVAVLTNCYNTDDPVFLSACSCACGLSPFSSAGCPNCPSAVTFGDYQFCTTSGTFGTGCLGSAQYCCSTGVSLFPRYTVCELQNAGAYQATIQVCDSIHTPEYIYITSPNTFFSDSSGRYNISMSVISAQTFFPGDIYVYDNSNSKGHFLDSSKVNKIREFNPTKFGFFQLINGLIPYYASYAEGFSISEQNCLSNMFQIDSTVPLFRDIVPSSRSEDDLPIFDSGYILYQDDFSLTWFGITPQKTFAVSPLTQIYPGPGVISQGCITLYGDYSDISNNPTCSYYAYTPNILTYNCYSQFNGYTQGIVQCNNVSAMVQYNRFQNTISCNPTQVSNFMAPVYPNPVSIKSIALGYNGVLNLYQNKTLPTRTPVNVDLPLTGTVEMSLYYLGYSVSFESTNTKPVITCMTLSQTTLTFKAYSTLSSGQCYASTNPITFSALSVSLTQSITSYSAQLLSVNYTGPLNLTLTCGMNTASYCVNVTVDQGCFQPSNPTNLDAFSPWGTFSGLSVGQIFLKLLGILISVFVGILALYILFIFIRYCFQLCSKRMKNKAKMQQSNEDSDEDVEMNPPELRSVSEQAVNPKEVVRRRTNIGRSKK